MNELERFLVGDLATAGLVDRREPVRSCEVPLRSFGGRVRFAGRIRTVRCNEDSAPLKGVLPSPANRAVLVVGGAPRCIARCSATSSPALRWATAGPGSSSTVLSRTSLCPADMPLAVKALGSNPGKCAKAAVGEVDVPVACGGSPSCPWRPFGDEDGITVL